MKAEREKSSANVAAATLRMTSGRLELPADEETCCFLLVSEGSCNLQVGEKNLLVNPGSALLLGAGGAVFTQAGYAVPELVGCRFPLSALHDLRSATQRDFARLFLPGEVTVLYGPVQWSSRLRTLLEMMRAAMPEQDYPGGLYLLLVLHYVEQECWRRAVRWPAPTTIPLSRCVPIWPPTTGRSSLLPRWRRGFIFHRTT